VGTLMHIHLFAAIAWIGGSILMFVLGVSLRSKKQQEEVYPNIGPVFGYFESVSLILLISTGILLIIDNGLITRLFSEESSDVITYLTMKIFVVISVVIATIVHYVIASKTNNKERSTLQNFISRASSLFIFIANIVILHYAIMIRELI
jgi:putative copper export protein